LKTLLIIWYSRTGASEALALACAQAAAREFELDPLHSYQVVQQRCDAVGSESLLAACAFVFVCPENLGSMAGAMKEFFDGHYYSALGKLNGRSFACMVAAGTDGAGAVLQIERIATGWRLKKVAESVIVNTQAQSPEEICAQKALNVDQLKSASDLGQLLAAGLVLGIY
jgi:multimeric flavodoxin WrbA